MIAIASNNISLLSFCDRRVDHVAKAAYEAQLFNVYAPISGVIVAQNVTQAAAAGVSLSGSVTAFTIADLSTVWIICDVYENDISKL